MNILCVKWGTKYSSEYVNKLYNMVLKNCNGQYFDFYCYTDNPSDLKSNIKTVNINSDLKDWWPKLDLLNIFNKDLNIFFDLDVIILNPLERLFSVKTRTFSVLYSQWKEGYLMPTAKEKYPTLYNSSIMKWEGNQGFKIYDYFQKNKEMVLFKYQGIDRYLFNEPVEVDLLPTSIAYSYWKGVRYGKDTTPEKLRKDYEVCILNHGSKQQNLNTWIKDYWI
jgi:hypothetical protein